MFKKKSLFKPLLNSEWIYMQEHARLELHHSSVTLTSSHVDWDLLSGFSGSPLQCCPYSCCVVAVSTVIIGTAHSDSESYKFVGTTYLALVTGFPMEQILNKINKQMQPPTPHLAILHKILYAPTNCHNWVHLSSGAPFMDHACIYPLDWNLECMHKWCNPKQWQG